MACPLCGDPCTCSAAGSLEAGERVAVLIDPDSSDNSVQQFCSTQEAPSRPTYSPARVAVGQTATASADPDFYRSPNDSAWRDEIASRVQAHKARRRKKFDPEASLSFGFDVHTDEVVEKESPLSQTFAPSARPRISQEESSSEVLPDIAEASPSQSRPKPQPRMYRRIALELEAEARAVLEEAGNLIEFPRPPVTENLFADELAESIIDTPRILEASVEEPLPSAEALPALATIRLDEDLERGVPEWIRNHHDKQDDDELLLPLQVAPLQPRFISASVDTALVLTSAALFSVIVLSISKFVPQGRMATISAIALISVLWLTYHYVFLVFGGTTPGMQVAQLELCSFEGCVPLRKSRGRRAFAMAISCMSLGLGFAWSVIDEDSLCWHDRITRTYMRIS